MLDTVIASIGFVIAVMSFIGGFRMIRRTDHAAETIMHRVNGFLAIGLYVLIAAISLYEKATLIIAALYLLGLMVHLVKIPLVRKGLAVRYGGYMGAMLLITWLAVIFTHLPS